MTNWKYDWDVQIWHGSTPPWCAVACCDTSAGFVRLSERHGITQMALVADTVLRCADYENGTMLTDAAEHERDLRIEKIGKSWEINSWREIDGTWSGYVIDRKRDIYGSKLTGVEKKIALLEALLEDVENIEKHRQVSGSSWCSFVGCLMQLSGRFPSKSVENLRVTDAHGSTIEMLDGNLTITPDGAETAAAYFKLDWSIQCHQSPQEDAWHAYAFIKGSVPRIVTPCIVHPKQVTALLGVMEHMRKHEDQVVTGSRCDIRPLTFKQWSP